MSRPSLSSWFDDVGFYWLRSTNNEVLIVQSSPHPGYLVLLRSKYVPQYNILEHTLPLFLPLTSLFTYNLSVTRMTCCFVYYFTFLFHACFVTSGISKDRVTKVFSLIWADKYVNQALPQTFSATVPEIWPLLQPPTFPNLLCSHHLSYWRCILPDTDSCQTLKSWSMIIWLWSGNRVGPERKFWT
jgi:hypothetical protein